MRTGLLVLLCLAVLAAPARAAKPFFVGSGGDPGIAVDADGTAHVAWWEEGNATRPDAVRYCRVLRGTRRCAASVTLPTADGPQILTRDVQVLLPRPGAVLIVAPRVNHPAVIFSSADGGTTFATLALPVEVNIEEALVGPGDTLSVLADRFGAYGQFGLDGSGAAGFPVSFGDATETLDQTLVLDAGRPAVFIAGDAGLKSFAWTGAGSPNDQAAWLPGPAMPYGSWSPSAASGPAGTFLAFVRRENGRRGTWVRPFTPAGFGRARRVTRADTTPELVQWPRGKLTVLYEQRDALRYRHSRTGRRWSKARRLFSGNEPTAVRAVAGPRGGWMVWDGDVGPSAGEPIRLVALPR